MMNKQLLAVNETVVNVVVVDVDKKHGRYLFKWGKGGLWEKIWLPYHECNRGGLNIVRGDSGKLVQYQGVYYKTYEFIPNAGV